MRCNKLVATLAFAAAVSAQNPPDATRLAPVSGQLVTDTGLPVPGQVIRFTSSGREPVEAKTDGNGGFDTTVEVNRPTFLEIAADGFARTVVDLGVVDSSIGLGSIVLQSLTSPAKPPGSCSLTGHLSDSLGRPLTSTSPRPFPFRTA
ncbi:MAG: hypothetical protein SGI92_28335 [Bryobacteraceae bacterium]|nr:hypothetical protein [Bryobacteraceae bacterium]